MAKTEMRVLLEPTGDSFRININTKTQKTLDLINFRLVEGANKIRNKMINNMRRTPRTGKVYKRGRKKHIASSPGNAPAIDTGQLLRSLTAFKGGDYVEVGSTLDKIPTFLEKGTKRMAPRPFLEPAVKAEFPRIKSRIQSDLRAMLRR